MSQSIQAPLERDSPTGQGTYVCGDGECAVFLGENQDNCPQDCLPGSSNNPALPATEGRIAFDFNPFMLLAGILMMLTLIIPLIYWRKKTKVAWSFFVWGSLIWLINIIIKTILDLTVSPALSSLLAAGTSAIGLFIYSLHFGIRTGVFESGLSYFFVWLKKKLRMASWREAVAFGIGFGGLENFLLGLYSFGSLALFLAAPQILNLLPSAIQKEYQMAFGGSSLLIFPPAIERLSVLFVHILCSVLVFLAIRTGKLRYFWYSFLFKMIIDGTALYLQKIPASSFLIFAYLVQIPILVYGIIGVIGIKKIKKRYPDNLATVVRGKELTN